MIKRPAIKIFSLQVLFFFFSESNSEILPTTFQWRAYIYKNLFKMKSHRVHSPCKEWGGPRLIKKGLRIFNHREILFSMKAKVGFVRPSSKPTDLSCKRKCPSAEHSFFSEIIRQVFYIELLIDSLLLVAEELKNKLNCILCTGTPIGWKSWKVHFVFNSFDIEMFPSPKLISGFLPASSPSTWFSNERLIKDWCSMFVTSPLSLIAQECQRCHP